MEKAKRTEPVRVNKVAIVLLSLGAHIVGYTPVVMIMQRPLVLVFILAAVLLLSVFSVRKYTSRATEAPSPAEFFLGGLEAISMPAFIGTVWMAVYGFLFGLSKLVEVLIHLFGGQATVNAGSIAFYPTIVVGGIIAAILSTSPVQDLCRKLYPDTAGIRSNYSKFFTTNRSRMIAAVIGSLIFLLIPWLMLVVTDWNRYFILVLIQLAFFVLGSLFLSETRTERAEKRKRIDIVESVKRLLEAAGYQTEISPRTQDASIDPLLTNLDILARKGKHNLLLDIKSPMDADKQVDWKSTSTLIQSAYLFCSGRGIRQKNMDARLLLVDVEPDKSFRKFSNREDIPILRVSGSQIQALLEMDTEEEQGRAVEEMFDLPRRARRRVRTEKVNRGRTDHE